MSSIFGNNSVAALSDTVITSVADNEILTYDSATGTWINEAASLATLSAVDNVTITGNTSGEILKWNGSAWINNTLAEAGIQAADADLTDIAGLTGNKGDLIVHDGTNWVDVAVGSNDQVLTADSAESSGIMWATASGGGADPSMMPAISQAGLSNAGVSLIRGGWEVTTTLNASAVGLGDLVFFPVYVPKTTTYNNISFNVSTAGTSGNVVELILYSIGTDGLPDTKVLETGSMAVDALGLVVSAIDTSIDVGRYWLGVLYDNNNANDGAVTAFTSTDGNVERHMIRNSVLSGRYTGLKHAGSYTVGNAPTNPSGFTYHGNNVIMVWLEVD